MHENQQLTRSDGQLQRVEIEIADIEQQLQDVRQELRSHETEPGTGAQLPTVVISTNPNLADLALRICHSCGIMFVSLNKDRHQSLHETLTRLEERRRELSRKEKTLKILCIFDP